MHVPMLEAFRVIPALLLALVVAPVRPCQGQQPGVNQGEEQRREQQERARDVLAFLGVTPGASVADVGAGGGFYTVRLARLVGPTGKVVAVDIDPRVLDRLRQRVREEQLSNVEVVQGKADDPLLAENSFDAILIVNAYHEMVDHQAVLRHLRTALKPQGKLVLLEPLDTSLRNATRDQQTTKHSIASSYAIGELRDAGFAVVTLQDPFLRQGALDEKWLAIAQPLSEGSEKLPAGMCPLKTSATHQAPGGAERDPLNDPSLRVPLSDFKRRWCRGDVLVVDVRDKDSYRAGHIPRAVSIPLDVLGDHVAELRKETRPIVTYCS
jgi:precorrin-6B methylase 2